MSSPLAGLIEADTLGIHNFREAVNSVVSCWVGGSEFQLISLVCVCGLKKGTSDLQTYDTLM